MLSLSLPQPVLELKEVSKRFGRLRVLDRVSLQLRPGRVTALLGPNAAGKSTLIKVILGLTRPDSGQVLVDGLPLDGDPGYRERIGYMPQAAHFPENLTGREVVSMLRDLRQESAEDDRLFQELGLEPELTKRIHHMSGGTRQKLNAAVAFLFRPSILILDEPTAGLDPVASNVLKARISQCRAQGMTVVLTSHVLAEAEELVDDVVLLMDGRVAFEGTLRQLRESTGESRLEPAVARVMKRGSW